MRCETTTGKRTAASTAGAAQAVTSSLSDNRKPKPKPKSKPPTRAIGHFTALVWKGSTKVGCALNTGCGNKFGAGFQNNAFVCRYFPAGNLILNGNSTAPENVLLPGSGDCDQPALGASALHPTEVTHAQTSFAVATTDECSCDRGECKTNWRESSSDSCQASWSSSGTGPAGAPDLMVWTHTCTCIV